jgi:ketosteroid isomerase-like protein
MSRKLWDAERTWARALETNDPALLADLVDAEFSFIGPDGEYEERDAYLAGYRSLAQQGIKVDEIALSDVKLRELGDTGIVTGRVLAKLTLKGQPLTEDVRFTRVYQRRGAAWRMVAGQGTRIAAPSSSRP